MRNSKPYCPSPLRPSLFYCQADEGHHARLTVGELILGAAEEDKAAIEEDGRPKNGWNQL